MCVTVCVLNIYIHVYVCVTVCYICYFSARSRKLADQKKMEKRFCSTASYTRQTARIGQRIRRIRKGNSTNSFGFFLFSSVWCLLFKKLRFYFLEKK